MKTVVALFALFLFCLSVSAQTKKVFILANGDYSARPDGAASYILLQKLEDSVYIVRQYNMTDSIMMQGYYKDSTLSVPNGKFTYYQLVKQNLGDKTAMQISRNALLKVGYYVNGAKNGTWIMFGANGSKRESATYQDDKLNGSYQNYYDNGLLYRSGNYVNGKKDSKWDNYNNWGKLWYTEEYKDDEVIKSIKMFAEASLPRGFFDDLARELGRDYDFLRQTGVSVVLKTDAKGHVLKADMMFDYSKLSYSEKATLRRITDVLLAQTVIPQIENGQPQSGELWFSVSNRIGATNDTNADQNAKQMTIISHHADQIGRGLNRVGQGKPVTE